MNVGLIEQQLQRKVIHTVSQNCVGIAIYLRGKEKEDRHLCWTVIVEDDENWFVSRNGISTAWLHELEISLPIVRRWLNDHAVRTKWGWALREKEEE